MSVDHYFTIGSLHANSGEPCEDYALSGRLADGREYGVVCDGCSGSAGHTDIGARVLALAMRETLEATPLLSDCFTASFTERLLQCVQRLQPSADWRDYLASIVAFVVDGTSLKALMLGDGAFAWTSADGDLTLVDVQWPSSMPLYLGYRLCAKEQAHFEQWAAQPGFAVRRLTFTTRDIELSATAPALERLQVEELAFADVSAGLVLQFDRTDLASFAVFSDGVGRVSEVSALHACRDLLAFKNREGSFVKRRALKALARFAREGHRPEDDLSAAAWVPC